MIPKKDLLLLLLLSFLLIVAANIGKISVFPEKYPDKPINLIVPYTAGGPTDLLARVLERPAYAQFGHPLIVTNMPGAGGTMAWNELAGAKPDGYTLGITSMVLILQPLYGETRYHYATALDPVAQLVSSPTLLVIRGDQPWQNINELIQYAKNHPGEIKFAHSGLGTSHHLFGEIFAREAGIDIIQVPFRGDSEAIAALLGGHTQITFVTPTSVKEHVKNGSVRILAVADEQRLSDSAFASAPTFKEQGLNLVFQIWYGIGAPKQLPPDVKSRLEAGFKEIAQDPEFRRSVENLGLMVDYLDSQQSTTKWVEQNDNMSKFLKETGIDEIVKAKKK